MPSDHEFLQRRLQLVRRQLHTSERDVVYDGQGRGRKATVADEVNQENTYKREARLLCHILAVTREGQVERALQQWRAKFGAQLAEHRARHKAAFDAYDAWCSLPPHERQRVPKPPRPPQAIYTDQSGQEWVITDAFLLMLDDLRERLARWLVDE
jgi:hypothetical protein